MIHPMLEADADNEGWCGIPDNIKADMQAALHESAEEKTIPHEMIKQRYQKNGCQINDVSCIKVV